MCNLRSALECAYTSPGNSLFSLLVSVVQSDSLMSVAIYEVSTLMMGETHGFVRKRLMGRSSGRYEAFSLQFSPTSNKEFFMTVQIEYDAAHNPKSATVVVGDRTHLVPLRKTVDGWEPNIPTDFPSGEKLAAEFKIAFAITERYSSAQT